MPPYEGSLVSILFAFDILIQNDLSLAHRSTFEGGLENDQMCRYNCYPFQA